MGTMGTFYSGVQVNALDLSTNYAGILMSVGNTLNAIIGMVAPYVVGLMTPEVSFTGFEFSVISLTTLILSENSRPVANGLLGHFRRLCPLHRCLFLVGIC